MDFKELNHLLKLVFLCRFHENHRRTIEPYPPIRYLCLFPNLGKKTNTKESLNQDHIFRAIVQCQVGGKRKK